MSKIVELEVAFKLPVEIDQRTGEYSLRVVSTRTGNPPLVFFEMNLSTFCGFVINLGIIF